MNIDYKAQKYIRYCDEHNKTKLIIFLKKLFMININNNKLKN